MRGADRIADRLVHRLGEAADLADVEIDPADLVLVALPGDQADFGLNDAGGPDHHVSHPLGHHAEVDEKRSFGNEKTMKQSGQQLAAGGGVNNLRDVCNTLDHEEVNAERKSLLEVALLLDRIGIRDAGWRRT